VRTGRNRVSLAYWLGMLTQTVSLGRSNPARRAESGNHCLHFVRVDALRARIHGRGNIEIRLA
jgi:hypothetical protein